MMLYMSRKKNSMGLVVLFFIFLQWWTTAKGEYYWNVMERITDYRQTVTLLCVTGNDTQSNVGVWDRYEDRPYPRLIFAAVKNESRPSHYKYGGGFIEGGFTLEIRNVSSEDFNSSYECSTNFGKSPHKVLEEKDVFAGSMNLVIQQTIENYGDSLTIKCKTNSCYSERCPWTYGWRMNDTELLLEDTEEHDNGSFNKYYSKLVLDGFTLEIRNFSRKDMNFNYQCYLPFNKSVSLELTKHNVFNDRVYVVTDKRKGVYVMVAITVIVCLLNIFLMVATAFSRRVKVRTPIEKTKELSYLSSGDVDLFIRALKSGFYLSYVGKIMCVGNEGVGKTSITTVLKGGIPDKVRHSTEGIDLHIHKAAVDIKKRKWVLRELDVFDVAYRDLLKTPNTQRRFVTDLDSDRHNTFDASRPILEDGFIDDEPNSSCQSCELLAENSRIIKSKAMSPTKRKQRKLKLHWKKTTLANVKVKHIDINKLKKEGLKRERKGLLSSSLAPVNMMDFGGQIAFYSTHQSFLTYRGIYILVIDGSRDFDSKIETESLIPVRAEKPTTRDFVLFWVSSIESYSRGVSDEFPQILIVCTHKDKVPKEKIEEKLNTIFTEIENMFKGTPAINHLLLKHRIFLDALNPDDPDYENLKDVLAESLCSQPTWGEQLPKSWIYLKMVINKAVVEGKNIMTLDTLRRLNQKHPLKALSDEDIKLFLKMHHEQGDIIFFPVPGLKDTIVISPQLLIKALQSLITDQRFCEGQRQSIVKTMNKNGILKRHDIEELWGKEEFFEHKDFLIVLMNHLDILATPQMYDESGSLIKSDQFYVPCLVKTRMDPENLMNSMNLNGKVLGLSFKFLSHTMPPAIGYRFIASCINMYEVKRHNEKPMLFSGMVVVNVKTDLELLVLLRSNRIDIYLVPINLEFDIVKHISERICKCLKDILSSIVNSFIVTSSEGEITTPLPFHTEFSCCNISSPCYNKEADDWTCSHGHTMTWEMKNKSISIQTQESCSMECEGLTLADQQERLSELHLAKLALQYGWEDLKKLVRKLGLDNNDIKRIEHDYAGNILNVMFCCLKKLKTKVHPTVRDLIKAIQEIKLDEHSACSMFRDKQLSVPDEVLMTEPTDKILDAISNEVITESLVLSVQLGQNASFWLAMREEREKIFQINREVLAKWKLDQRVERKNDIRDLAQALCNVGIDITLFL